MKKLGLTIMIILGGASLNAQDASNLPGNKELPTSQWKIHGI